MQPNSLFKPPFRPDPGSGQVVPRFPPSPSPFPSTRLIIIVIPRGFDSRGKTRIRKTSCLNSTLDRLLTFAKVVELRKSLSINLPVQYIGISNAPGALNPNFHPLLPSNPISSSSSLACLLACFFDSSLLQFRDRQSGQSQRFQGSLRAWTAKGSCHLSTTIQFPLPVPLCTKIERRSLSTEDAARTHTLPKRTWGLIRAPSRVIISPL